MRCAVLATAVLLAACGSPSQQSEATRAATPSPSASPGLLYTCGGTPFDPALLEGPGGVEREDSELGEALRELMETVDGAILKQAEEWRVVAEDGERVGLVGLVDGGAYMSASFERSGSAWSPLGWGDCRPRVAIGNRSPATWELAGEPSPGDTRLVVLASETACSSGRELTPDITRSDVHYTEDAISIIVSADSIVGGDCQGNPPSRLEVELDEPLGDRVLLDAAVFPPEQRYP